MLILRRISSDGVEMNKEVGNAYTFIHREINPIDFQSTFELYFQKPHVADLDEKSDDDTKNVYAFVCNIDYLQPLFKKQRAFMMTDNGQTFANLSFK